MVDKYGTYEEGPDHYDDKCDERADDQPDHIARHAVTKRLLCRCLCTHHGTVRYGTVRVEQIK